HAIKSVHVYDYDLSAEYHHANMPNANVHVTTHHALLHIAIAHGAVNQNVLEGVEVFVSHFRADDVRFGNNFHQRHAGAVEIHPAVPLDMKILSDVFLQVRASDSHASEAAVELDIDVATDSGRLVVLGDLIIL